jgi:hypothetical protein
MTSPNMLPGITSFVPCPTDAPTDAPTKAPTKAPPTAPTKAPTDAPGTMNGQRGLASNSVEGSASTQPGVRRGRDAVQPVIVAPLGAPHFEQTHPLVPVPAGACAVSQGASPRPKAALNPCPWLLDGGVLCVSAPREPPELKDLRGFRNAPLWSTRGLWSPRRGCAGAKSRF